MSISIPPHGEVCKFVSRGKERSINRSYSGANLGFEQRLWLAADKLRSNIDAAEYKHVVLGLVFLKYISDSFEERHRQMVEEAKTDNLINPEDPDLYTMETIFWVPKEPDTQNQIVLNEVGCREV